MSFNFLIAATIMINFASLNNTFKLKRTNITVIISTLLSCCRVEGPSLLCFAKYHEKRCKTSGRKFYLLWLFKSFVRFLESQATEEDGLRSRWM